MNIVVSLDHPRRPSPRRIAPGDTLRIGSPTDLGDDKVPRLDVAGWEHELSLRSIEIYNTGSVLQFSVFQEPTTAAVVIETGGGNDGPMTAMGTLTFAPPFDLKVAITFHSGDASIRIGVLSDLYSPTPKYTNKGSAHSLDSDTLKRLVNAIAVANEEKTGREITQTKVASFFYATPGKSQTRVKSMMNLVEKVAKQYGLEGRLFDHLLAEATRRGEIDPMLMDELRNGGQ